MSQFDHESEQDYKPNPRNLLGIFIFLIGLSLWAFAAAAIGDTLVNLHIAVQMIWYAVAGISWIFPAIKLFAWMARGTLK